MNPNGLTDEQVKQGYSTIPGNFDPVTGQLKTTITSASLAPQPSPDLSQSFTPQSNLATPVVAEATANQEGFQSDYQRYLDLQNQGQDNSLANMIAGIDLQSLTGRGGAQAEAEGRLGVNQFNQAIADLSSQRVSKLAAYNQSIAQQRAEQAQLEAGAGAKGLTTAMLGGQQAALARLREAENQTAAAEIGLLDAQILGTQGKLEAAQNAANRAVDLMYQDREAQVNTKLKQIELYTPIFNAQEKKKADALTFALNKENERLQTEKENAKSIENMVINASSQSAPQDLVNRARKAKTPSEAAMILGQYAGDFYKTELLKQQIATEKAQRSKIYADMAKTQTPAVSDASSLQEATKNLKLTEAQSKALAFGQRAINADKALRERLQTYDPTTIFSATGRLLKTDNARAFERDLADFITAVLRKESGATITEDEFARFIPIYSPQGVLTNQKDVEQTNMKRDAAIDALISEAGPASSALASYKNTVGKISVDNASNPFTQALGQNNQTIPGTSIVNKVNDDGSIMFTIPK